ncbi:MAG: DUF4880 domain-containing protein [Alphaproteobacteria bacterium]|nr:DUF4880 domain-containing protein [Alphaproteobacteria bacterium]
MVGRSVRRATDDAAHDDADRRAGMTTSDEDRKKAATEAARWLVSLEEDPDDASLRARFDAWLATSPVNAVAWRHTAEIYDLMEKVPPAHAEHWRRRAGARDRIASLQGRDMPALRQARPAGPPRRRRLIVAAVMAMAACLAVVLLPSVLLWLEADHVTSTAEQRSLALQDGSTIRLAPDSAVAIDYTADRRLVRLIRGEAFFDVAAMPSRPFRVVARNLTVTVLGTHFDVRLGEDEAVVAVRQGRVNVGPASTPARRAATERLDAGNWMRIDRSGAVRRGTVPPNEVGAWLDGQIVARDRRLSDVVDDLRRYYAGMIVLADRQFGEQAVSGVYNVADPVAAMRAVVGAHGGVVHQVSPWIIVVSGS